MGRKSTFLMGLAASVLLLSGCGDDSGNGDGDGDNGGGTAGDALGPIPEDLASGASHLSIEGAVTDAGDYTTDDDDRYAGTSADSYRPANDGTNADGPYIIRIYTDASHQDDPDNVVRSWISVTLPDDAEPGVYTISDSRNADDGDAVASVAGDGYGWRFGRNVAGTLHIHDVGEQISALWEFGASSGSGDDAPSVDVSGAVNELAFEPQAEVRFSMTVDGETQEHVNRVGANTGGNSYSLNLGESIYLGFELDADEGTYAVDGRRGDGVVGLTMPDYPFEDVDGELVLERADGAFSGTFSLTTTGDQPVTLDGRFDHVGVPDAG